MSFAGRAAWLGALLAALWVLMWLGEDPRLAGPGWSHWSGWFDVGAWSSWLRATEPLDATFSLLRSGLLLVDAYLVIVTVLAGAARATGAIRAVRWLDAVTLPILRPMVHSLVGVGLVASSLGGAPAFAAPGDGPPPAWGPPREPITRVLEQPTRPPPLLRRLPPDPAGTKPPDGSVPPVEEPPPAGDDTDPTPGGERRPEAPQGTMAASTWVVAPGDQFWANAERRLAARADGNLTDAEVTVYWQQLIAANTDRLHRAGHPDLLLPGQRLVLPPVEPRGERPETADSTRPKSG